MKTSNDMKKNTVYKISVITICINIFLAILKITAGSFGHSHGMVSDALHSVSDIVSTFLVILSAILCKNAVTEKDIRKNEVIEAVFSFILAGILIITCFDIFYDGIKRIISKEYLTAEIPAWYELLVAITAILFKEGIFIYTVKKAKEIDYPPLTANAWHQRADAWTSLATLIGILCVWLFNFKLADTISGLLIAVFILYIAVNIILGGISKLTGKKISFGHTHTHELTPFDNETKINL